MKTFEVMIAKKRTESSTGFISPEWWPEVVNRVQVLALEKKEHAATRPSLLKDAEGLPLEGAICLCKDEVWDIIAAKNDTRITLLTPDQANEKGQQWKPQINIVRNETVVAGVTSKLALGIDLSDEDLKAMDPDDETPGYNLTPLFDVVEISSGMGEPIE